MKNLFYAVYIRERLSLGLDSIYILLIQCMVIYTHVKGIIHISNKNYQGAVETSGGVDPDLLQKFLQLLFNLIQLSLAHSIQLKLRGTVDSFSRCMSDIIYRNAGLLSSEKPFLYSSQIPYLRTSID